MTVTVTANSNQPHEYNLKQLQNNITSLTAFIAGTTNGSVAQNTANAQLMSMQREFVDALMNSGKLSAATILSTCTYST